MRLNVCAKLTGATGTSSVSSGSLATSFPNVRYDLFFTLVFSILNAQIRFFLTLVYSANEHGALFVLVFFFVVVLIRVVAHGTIALCVPSKKANVASSSAALSAVRGFFASGDVSSNCCLRFPRFL